ncbi:hypothetical protein GCM10023169_16490 [Georgenia halophila]|uniref:Uncharacterized protein n=1 Tax=Georgenia halophila TaxID=620889 RepID=A0ABP8L3Y8_9MICO
MAQIPQPQTYTLPPAAPNHNHGRTKAAWVLAIGASIGVLVVGLGLIFSSMPVTVAGVVVTVVALVVSAVMRGMGLGQPDSREDGEPRDWYGS